MDDILASYQAKIRTTFAFLKAAASPAELHARRLPLLGYDGFLVPVVSLGGRAVHIPYEVTWQHEHVPEDEMPKNGWRRIPSIAELPALLDEI